MLVGFQESVLVCRRWKNILYEPTFWQARLATAEKTVTSLKLASDSAQPHFFGFRRLAMVHLPHEQVFLADEMATGRRVVLSCVSIVEGEHPSPLIFQLQVLSQYRALCCVNHVLTVNHQLLFLRCTSVTLFLDVLTSRSFAIENPLPHFWKLGPEIQSFWPSLVNWMLFATADGTGTFLCGPVFFQAVALVRKAYGRHVANPGIPAPSASNFRLVAAAALFLIGAPAGNIFSLENLARQLQGNSWTVENSRSGEIWHMAMHTLLRQHANSLGEPNIFNICHHFIARGGFDPTVYHDYRMKNFILLSLLVAASPTLENFYSTQVLAACVMSLAVFAIPTDSWPETCERLTGLSWKNLPLTEIRNVLEEELQLHQQHAFSGIAVYIFSHEIAYGPTLPAVWELEDAYRRERSRREA
jgi:hypothetical protein